MTITQTIDELPDPPDPASDSADEFSDKAAASVLAQKNMVPQLNTVIDQMNDTALGVSNDAASSAASAAAAAISQSSAAASAASAIASATTNGTSGTSLTLGAGNQSLTTQPGKNWAPGMWINCVRTSDRSKSMSGYIDSYNSGTGALVLVVVAANVSGTGTFTDWTLTVAGLPGSIFNLVDLTLLGPSIRPSFMNDFANAKRHDSRWTYTMASTLTYFDAALILREAAAGVPAFDHDPVTGRCLGEWFSEFRTNSIRNNTMQGVAAGTPGTPPTNWYASSSNGLSSSIVGSGVEDGIEYVDVRFFGTATSVGFSAVGFETSTGITAANAQTWSIASFIRMTAGSMSNISSAALCIDESTSGGSFVASGSGPALTMSATALKTSRQYYTRTLSGGATVARISPHIKLFNTATGGVDITIRIGLPTAEQGTYITPVIKTTNAAVTRNGPTLTAATSTFDFNAAEGTLMVSYTKSATVSVGCVAALQKAGAGTDYFELRDGSALGGSPGSTDLLIYAGGSSQVDTGGVATADGTLHIMVGAYKANDFAFSCDGNAVQTDTSGTVPVMDQLSLGAFGAALGSDRFAGWISKVAYYPKRLPNNELVALSTL